MPPRFLSFVIRKKKMGISYVRYLPLMSAMLILSLFPLFSPFVAISVNVQPKPTGKAT